MSQITTALITGATGGIGEALCREFARRRHNLIITARSRQKLEELAARLRKVYGIEVLAIPADLNQPDAAKKLYIEIRDSAKTVDYLINNAGFGLGGYFFHNKLKIQDAMIHVNVIAPTKLLRMFLPAMMDRGYGKILNVASTGAFAAGPYNSVYCATKAYILSLSEAVAREVEGSGVTVSTLCPGATRSGFARRANMESTRLFNHGVMSAASVAKTAYNGMMRGEKLITPGCLNKILLTAIKLSPRCLATRASGFIQRRYA